MKINQFVDKNLYNEKSLNLLSVRDLRDMGRKFGISSPTTLKKQELVDYILKVVYGEIVPPMRNVRGRPNVREFNMDKYIAKIKNNQELTPELMRATLDEDYGMMKVSSVTEQYENGEDLVQRVFFEENGECYLRVREFVASKEDIKISKAIAEKYGLINLDVIEIIICDDMFKIVTINGVKIKDKFENISVDGEPIKKGKRQDFYYSTKDEIYKKASMLIKLCEKNEIKTIVFGLKCECTNLVKSIYIEEIDDISQKYKKFVSFMGLCEKCAYDGEEYMVVIADYQTIDEIYMSFDDDVLSRIKKKVSTFLPKILKLKNSFAAFRLVTSVNY